MQSSQDVLAQSPGVGCPDVDELTVELPKRIFFHRSVEDAQLATNASVPGTPPAQRAANLGLAASTPLRRLYRATSEPTGSTVVAVSNSLGNPFMASEPLLNDLCAEFCHTGDASCFAKIISMSGKAEQIAALSEELVASVLQTALKNGFNEAGCEFILILLHKAALATMRQACCTVIELCELNASMDIAVQLSQSALNPLFSGAAVQLCCQRISEFRLQVLAQCIQFSVADVHSLLQSSLAPLLLVSLVIGKRFIIFMLIFVVFEPSKSSHSKVGS